METVITQRIISLVNEFAGGEKKEFARLIGQKQTTFNAWINNNKWSDVEKLEGMVAKLQGISRDWLYGGIGEMRVSKTYHTEGPISIVREGGCGECLIKNGQIDLLKEQLRDCHKEVGRLHECLGMSMGKGGKKQAY